MGRSPSVEGLNKGMWSAWEDRKLIEYVEAHGDKNWTKASRAAGLRRSGKSCRLRWLNYLKPDIKRGNISEDEEDLIVRLHRLLGNRWALIAGRLPGRTDNEIKNFWNTKMSKKQGASNKKMAKMLHPHQSSTVATINETPAILQTPLNQMKGNQLISSSGEMTANMCSTNLVNCISNNNTDLSWTVDDLELCMDFNFDGLMDLTEFGDINVNAGCQEAQDYTYQTNNIVVSNSHSSQLVEYKAVLPDQQYQSNDLQMLTSTLFEQTVAAEDDWLLDDNGMAGFGLVGSFQNYF